MGMRGPKPKYASAADRQRAYRQRVKIASQSHLLELSDIESELVEFMLGCVWDDFDAHYDTAIELFERAGLVPALVRRGRPGR